MGYAHIILLYIEVTKCYLVSLIPAPSELAAGRGSRRFYSLLGLRPNRIYLLWQDYIYITNLTRGVASLCHPSLFASRVAPS